MSITARQTAVICSVVRTSSKAEQATLVLLVHSNAQQLVKRINTASMITVSAGNGCDRLHLCIVINVQPALPDRNLVSASAGWRQTEHQDQ